MPAVRVIRYLAFQIYILTVNTAGAVLAIPPRRYSTAIWLLLYRHLRVTIAARELSSTVFLGFTSWYSSIVRVITLSTS